MRGKKSWLNGTKNFKGKTNFTAWHCSTRGASLEKISINNQDLALAFTAGFSRDKILAAYCVPAGKLGLQKDINKDSSQSIEQTFGRESIRPRLKLWDEVLTRKVLQRFDPRLVIKHANPVPADEQLLIEAHKVKCGVPSLSINEQRAKDGLKPVKDGENIHVPLNFVPLTSQRSSGRNDVED